MSEKPAIHLNNTIGKRVWIKASAEVVYRALTNSKDLEKWFCDRADCTPDEGGELIAFWKSGRDGHKGRAIFTSVVPYTSLEILWLEDGRETPPVSYKHTLHYTIKSKSGMTEVVMLDKSETPLDEETHTYIDRGWNFVLFELKDFCERKERLAKMRLESKLDPENA